MARQEWTTKGFIDEPAPAGCDLKAEIRRMCEEKKAVVMAHYYTRAEVQDVADFIGDSLALARKAAQTDARIIVMCGVHFMAETCKLLCPGKLVLAPDLNAGCSLADSCRADDLSRYKEEHPSHTVVSYVNTTAAVKALTDIVVTSGNAKKVIDSLPEDEPIIFGPDRNLGAYINSVTGRRMLLWPGACHVHERFAEAEVERLRQAHPGAKVLAHLECRAGVLAKADVAGSTAVMLKYVKESDDKEFIVATEPGILHEMRKACPQKTFLPVPLTDGGACNECEYMKMNTLLKVYNTLKHEWPQVEVDPAIAPLAVKPIERMLSLS